jgi:hypothetical protein
MNRPPRSILVETSPHKEIRFVDGDNMSAKEHDVESEGSKPRDHIRPLKHTWRPHKDWRVWVAVVLMLALILVYVMTDSLSLRPGKRPTVPTPAIAP